MSFLTAGSFFGRSKPLLTGCSNGRCECIHNIYCYIHVGLFFDHLLKKTTKYPWGFGNFNMHGLQLFLNKVHQFHLWCFIGQSRFSNQEQVKTSSRKWCTIPCPYLILWKLVTPNMKHGMYQTSMCWQCRSETELVIRRRDGFIVTYNIRYLRLKLPQQPKIEIANLIKHNHRIEKRYHGMFAAMNFATFSATVMKPITFSRMATWDQFCPFCYVVKERHWSVDILCSSIFFVAILAKVLLACRFSFDARMQTVASS